MDDQTGWKSFTWALDGLSSLKVGECYSRPFLFADCNWRLRAYGNDGYLCLYLELADSASLPPSWRRRVDYTFTLVNKGLSKSNIVTGGQYVFDTKNQKSWGCNEFVCLTKLHDKNEGFLVDDHLVIHAGLYFFPREEETENDAEESLDDHDLSKEGSDDDDDTSEVSSYGDDDDDDDDTSQSHLFEDIKVGFRPKNKKIRLAYMIEIAKFLGTVFQSSNKLSEDDMSNLNDTLVDLTDAGFDFDCLKTKFELSKVDWALKDLPAFQSDALVIGSCKCLGKGNLDVFEKSETKSADSNNLLNEKETMDVNGFQVLPSQVESVRRIFEKHPEIALEFRGKNQHLRKACMNFLLSLIETLCQSLEELSTVDLVEADIALTYLKDAGFKVDWLEKKLEQVVEKKKKEESSLAKLKETEETLLKLKQKCAELDALAEKQKAELSATRTPLSFDDILF